MEIHISASEGSIEQQQMLYCNTDFSKALSDQPRISNSCCFLCSAAVYHPAQSWQPHWVKAIWHSRGKLHCRKMGSGKGPVQSRSSEARLREDLSGVSLKVAGWGAEEGSASNHSVNRGWNPVPRVWRESGCAPPGALATGAHWGESEMAAGCGGLAVAAVHRSRDSTGCCHLGVRRPPLQ